MRPTTADQEAEARGDRQWLVILRERPALFGALLGGLTLTEREQVTRRIRRATEAERAGVVRVFANGGRVAQKGT